MDSVILRVSQLNRYVKSLLDENGAVRNILVRGELTSVHFRSQSGHRYFTLEEGGALLPCVMFRAYAERLGGFPEEGTSVLVRGSVTLYERDGRYQLLVYDITPLGRGKGAENVALLRQRLLKEGLFDPERKRPLPLFPRAVAVITSGEGAAVQDIIATLRQHNRLVRVILYPAAVQGPDAAGQMTEALRLAVREARADILILGRGGGSAEFLSVFNDERLLRAVASSPIPVISAVGHETDHTLLDEAADARAATPTAAALLCGISCLEMERRIRRARERITDSLRLSVREVQKRHADLLALLTARSPRQRIVKYRQKRDYLEKLLADGMRHRLCRADEKTRYLAERLLTLNPLAPLDRGYTVTFLDVPERTPARFSGLTAGDRLRTEFSDGTVISVVESLRAKEK